jgi:hypothetical protein
MEKGNMRMRQNTSRCTSISRPWPSAPVFNEKGGTETTVKSNREKRGERKEGRKENGVWSDDMSPSIGEAVQRRHRGERGRGEGCFQV